MTPLVGTVRPVTGTLTPIVGAVRPVTDASTPLATAARPVAGSPAAASPSAERDIGAGADASATRTALSTSLPRPDVAATADGRTPVGAQAMTGAQPALGQPGAFASTGDQVRARSRPTVTVTVPHRAGRIRCRGGASATGGAGGSTGLALGLLLVICALPGVHFGRLRLLPARVRSVQFVSRLERPG